MQVKTIKDYSTQLQELFPQYSKKEIDLMLKTSFQNLTQYINKGCTLYIESKKDKYSIVIGTTPKDGETFYKEYIKKLKNTLKLLYQKKTKEWDNYYYFISFKKLDTSNTITLKNILIAKSLDWLISQNTKKGYVYRFKSNSDIGFNKTLKQFTSSSIEYVKQIAKRKFSDLMVTNASYQTIKKTYTNGTRNFKYLLGRISNGFKSNADS